MYNNFLILLHIVVGSRAIKTVENRWSITLKRLARPVETNRV